VTGNAYFHRVYTLHYTVTPSVIWEMGVYERDGQEPRANSRTRAEATKEFVTLERARTEKGEFVNLEGALLEGVSLVDADLRGVKLWGCRLFNVDLSNADLRDADFRGALVGSTEHNPAQLSGAKLTDANFEGINLTGVPFARCDMRGVRLNSASLRSVLLLQTDLRRAELYGLKNWKEIEAVRGANIFGIKDAPDGFREWAISEGAVEIPNDEDWRRTLGSVGKLMDFVHLNRCLEWTF
jgi:hypothetical protein